MLHLEQVIQDPASEPNGGDASLDGLASANVASRATDEPSDAMPLVGYIEVPVKDIVGYLSAPDDDGDAMVGQSVIWIRRNATLVWHESVRAPSLQTPQSVVRLKWPR
jgi:hypothetical protein